MTETSILLPAMALVGWTLCVLLLMPYQRFKAVLSRQVEVDDFKFGESARVPHGVSIPNRNYMNLLELPVLFYVVSLIAYVSHHADSVALVLAWSYVGLRIVHSLVHLSYNNVIHRMSVFAVSNVVLGVLWTRLLIEFVR